jgi:hypothetical protein
MFTEALADAMGESYSEICSILETDVTMEGAKDALNCRRAKLMRFYEHT